MKLSICPMLAFLSSITTALPSPAPAPVALAPRAVPTFSQRAIFNPPSSYKTPKVLYGRTAILSDGSLLGTWENYSPEPPRVYFPIYKSTNNGASWKPLSNVTDQVNGWGMRYQPVLYTLPSAFAGYPAGTVLCAGNSIPSDLSKTKLDLYASTDAGKTWRFVSSIASGGRAVPNNGETPVWEPFLLLHNGQLIAYYSDQRDPAYGQKLVHQTTTDLKTWGAVVADVVYPTYTERPGMTTVARMGTGNWIMTYEYGGGPGSPAFPSYQFPVYAKIAADPTKFGATTGFQVRASDGTQPTSSPYLVWSASGGANGTLVVNAGSNSEIFTNKARGLGPWTRVSVPEGPGYSRGLCVLDALGSLMIFGAGSLNQDNYVSNAVVHLP